jgi:diguanylate cyclase (GGDEF)-like protein
MNRGGDMADSIILCIDDDTTVLSALRTLLVKHLGPGFVVEVAESGDEALEIQQELHATGQFLSVVISDYIMPGMRGDELLMKLHGLSPHTVNILLTGQSDLEGIKRAINGANLYRFIEKPFDNADVVLTVRSGAHAYAQARELERKNAELQKINSHLEELVDARTAELQEKNRQLELLAVTDPLTGAYNRLRLDQLLVAELARAERYNDPFCVIMMDVDKFKSVNDEYGHQAGDQLLIALVAILGKHTRQVDVVGRWGGEEFQILVPGQGLQKARDLAEKLRLQVAEYRFPTVGQRTASFGVAVFQSGDTITALIERADLALFRAKAKGRNRVECEA